MLELTGKHIKPKLSSRAVRPRHDGINSWTPEKRLLKNGINWKLVDDPLAYSRKIKWNNGSETFQGQFERPQLLIENGRPTHLFAATGDGLGGFNNMTRTWNMVVPLI